MDIKSAIAHLRILGFTINNHNYTTQHSFRNPRNGMRLLYLITPSDHKGYWINSLMTKDVRATTKLANFLNNNMDAKHENTKKTTV